MLIRFCLNPVSLDGSHEIDGGQGNRLVAPIAEHLEAMGAEYSVGAQPIRNAVNCYYSHRDHYNKVDREVAVFISHGIADKNWRNATGHYYRATFVSGPAWTYRLLDHKSPPHVIFEVGYPKLDPLYALREARPVNDKIVVVWAPTHGGGGMKYADVAAIPENMPNTFNAFRSSWWHRDEVLAALDDPRIEVIEAPHPRHRPDRQATFEEYLRADVIVADGGSTIYEAWALGIPVVFPAWLTYEGNTGGNSVGSMESTIYSTGIGRHAQSADMLVEHVIDAAALGITEGEETFVEQIIPTKYRGIGGKMHAETLIDLADGEDDPRHQAQLEWVRFSFAGKTQKVAVGTKDYHSLMKSKHWHLLTDRSPSVIRRAARRR